MPVLGVTRHAYNMYPWLPTPEGQDRDEEKEGIPDLAVYVDDLHLRPPLQRTDANGHRATLLGYAEHSMSHQYARAGVGRLLKLANLVLMFQDRNETRITVLRIANG